MRKSSYDVGYIKVTSALLNVRVETVGDLEDVATTIFEEALANKEFCDVYADFCERLETKCSTQRMVVTQSIDGDYYSLLEEKFPHKIAGPFETKGQSVVIWTW
ncbi:hypothetical protein F444_03131 [Phytophthora nicotianae P1976]|uniref:Uncharacterized protein n=1 Tax=Phytophthora nicotianae P1976 TaxID=1317066 RepID=A0A081AV53_PHYNI|nr:hypothetical protein F444_03131 [Phytophthora nicotianae P1976]